jgi:uncharacterized protein (DUF433 family)
MQPVIINEHIVADMGVCHGKPVFAGTRIMVWQVLEMLACSRTPVEILQAFPSLTPAHIAAALNYAAAVSHAPYGIPFRANPEIPA